MMDWKRSEIAFALEVVEQACVIAETVRREMASSVMEKKDLSPVTVADFAIQAFIAKKLAEQFPDDPLVAEESSEALREKGGAEILKRIKPLLTPHFPKVFDEDIAAWIDRGQQSPSRRFWTLDPIDGTKGFIRGDQYAVALALLVNHEVEIGVLGCPHLGQPFFESSTGVLTIAVKGKGSAYRALKSHDTFVPMRVSSFASTEEAVLLRSYEASHTSSTKTSEWMNALKFTKPPVLMDSLAKYAVVANGKADLLVRFPSRTQPLRRECIWDQAAGALLVEEAGGKVTDLDGKAFDYSAGCRLERNRGVLVTNGHLHQQALNALGGVSL